MRPALEVVGGTLGPPARTVCVFFALLNPVPANRITELDGLRGLAISLVLWHHLVEGYLPVGPASWLGWLRAATCLSWTGVDLFFVLSGYLIGGILIDHRDSPQLTRTFYIRRAARILPLYYATLAVYLGMAAIGAAGDLPPFSTWVYALFLTNIVIGLGNAWGSSLFSPLWSIAVEEQFYLTAPWIVRWMPAARLPGLLVALAASAWLLRTGLFYLHPESSHGAIHVLMPARMDTLALGGLLAWAARANAATVFFQRLARTWPVWLALCAALFVLLTANQYYQIARVNAYCGYTLLAGIHAFLLTLVAVVRVPWLVRLFSFQPLARLGRYSYFVYLWHMIIGWSVVKWLGGDDFALNSAGSLAIVLLAAGSTVLAGLLSWKFFEQPMIRLGHRASY